MTHEFDVVDEPEGDGGLSLRNKINLIAAALLGVALAIFIGQNTASQEVSWLSFDVDLPLWLVVVGSAAIGMVLAVVGQAMWRRRRRRRQEA